jgi:hypothetical protein
MAIIYAPELKRNARGGMSQAEYEKTMRELDVYKAKQDIALQSKQADTSTKLANEFLSSWNSYLAKSEGIYNQAIAGITKSYGYLDKASTSVDQIDSLVGSVMKEWEDYKGKFGELEDTAIESAKSEFGIRSDLMSTFRDLAKADYEGVAGRAKADVTGEFEKARQAEARRLQGLGIDPTSGRYQRAMLDMGGNEALSKTLAANTARTTEKKRVSDLATTGLQTINPNDTISAALNIRKGGTDLLTTGGNLASTAVAARSNLAGTAGTLASATGQIARDFGQSITQPIGEMGATMLGTSMATNTGTPARLGDRLSNASTKLNIKAP